MDGSVPIRQFRQRPGILDLGWGHPHPAALPVSAWATAYGQALERYGPSMLTYGNTAGPGPLVDWLRERHDEPRPDPDEMVITAGASPAIDLVCATTVAPDEAIVVQAPTYHLALRILRDHSPHLVPAPEDEHGLDPAATERVVDDLRRRGRRVALIYTVPVFANPTGRSLDPARRAALAGVAERAGALLVEDETYRELAYDGPPAASPYRTGSRAVRIGSFAKTVAPGLRLGWLVAPAAVAGRIVDRGYVHSGGGLNHATALAMAEFGRCGAYDAHLVAVRQRYRAQRDRLVRALRRHLPQAVFAVPGGGWFVWLTLPGLAAAELLPRAEAAGVSFVAGSRFYPGPGAGADRLRLSFARLDGDELDEAVRRLATAVAVLTA